MNAAARLPAMRWCGEWLVGYGVVCVNCGMVHRYDYQEKNSSTTLGQEKNSSTTLGQPKNKPRTPKPKKCGNLFCRELFTPERPLQNACCPACALAIVAQRKAKAEAKRAREYRSETNRMKKALRESDPKWWKKKAVAIFNAWIRWRDRFKPCISCGTWQTMQWDAGHYRPAGNNEALRFDPRNVHKQCCVCNDGNKKSGNLHGYRAGLLEREGPDVVAFLEGPQPLKRWSIDELRDICERYKLPKDAWEN